MPEDKRPDGLDRHSGKTKLFYLVRPVAGGMRGHLQQLVHWFSREYALYLGVPPGGDFLQTAALPADSFFHLPLSGGLNPAGDLLSCRRLYRLLHTLRPALLHIHGFKAALPGLPAARLARVPVLITVHNYPAHRAFYCMPAAGRVLGALKARYIAVSCSLADDLVARGIPREQISVIHNGIDPAPFAAAAANRYLQPRKLGELVVGTAARFAPQKGLPYFLQAAAVLAPLYPQMRFLVIGDGPGQPVLEKMARQLGLAERLSFYGYCTDLPRLLAGIDIFVLPSLTEGFPLTVLEAAAAGCTVVASKVGGIPEVIIDGVHGLLVPPADAAALARAIAALARDPGLARRLAWACHERVRTQFTLERMLSQTAAVYDRLVNESRCRLPEFTKPGAGGER